MNKLDKYIQDLLFLYDCVVIPNFGAFVTNYANAEHNHVTHTFFPPQKSIFFNTDITYNDGLLINTIAKNLDLTYLEAEKYVQSEVQQIWLDLEANKKVVFKNIGDFTYKKGTIIFNQYSEKNFLTNAFGFSVFRFPPLNYQKKNSHLSVSYNSTDMTPVIKKTIKWAAILIPFMSILALIPYVKNNDVQIAGFTFNKKVENVSKSIEETHSATVPISTNNDTNIVSIISKTTDKKSALFYSVETKKQTQRTITKQDNQQKTFYVIGASYKVKDKALKQANIFEKEGFTNVEVVEKNSLFRVSVSSYTDKVTALHELKRIRTKTQNETFWLLTD